MHSCSGYDMNKVFWLAESLPPIPRHISSQRPGGESRREVLKGGAKDISRSVSETYAYATSWTISAQDTAIVLETFANVRLSPLWIILHILLLLLISFLIRIVLTEQFRSKCCTFQDDAYYEWSYNETNVAWRKNTQGRSTRRLVHKVYVLYQCYLIIFLILLIWLSYLWILCLSIAELDGDQPVMFYYIAV